MLPIGHCFPSTRHLLWAVYLLGCSSPLVAHTPRKWCVCVSLLGENPEDTLSCDMLETSVLPVNCTENLPHWVIFSNTRFFQSTAMFPPHLSGVFADKDVPFGLSTDHLLLIVSAIFTAAERRTVPGVRCFFCCLMLLCKKLYKSFPNIYHCLGKYQKCGLRST